MRNRHVWLAACVVLTTASVTPAQQAADTILYNGRVLTVDKASRIVQALAVRGDQIVAVGDDASVLKRDRQSEAGWGAHEKLDRMTALRVATRNGANYILKGDVLGSLEPGKLADFAVLDRDYLTMPEDDISEIRPVLVMMDGKIQFLRTDFSQEYNLKPQGAEIGTHEELQKRRPRSDDGSGTRG
jgi:predicted amidohydrolase YtcJ